MSATSWLKVTRPDDGETVGYLEPLAADYSHVQPRNLLGHPVGRATDFLTADERLADRGIGELAEGWQLRDAEPAFRGGVAIVEVSPDGILVADAQLVKALVAGPRVSVPWPDLEGRLSLDL